MSYKSDRPSFQERLDHFVSVIRTEIINGIRQEGTYLPAESALAKQFQLSNKSIRKGLEQLVEEGLIQKIDRVGSMVTPRPKESITLNFGCPISLTTDFLIDELIAEFGRRNPGIHVRRITLNHLSYAQSAQEMISNGLLDVVAFNSPQFQEWTEEGLTSLLEGLDSDPDIYPIAEEAFRVDGVGYAKPVSFSPVVLCYNKRHFQEAGIHEPDSYWTWSDLMAAASKLSKSRGRHGIYFLPASENRYPVFLLQGFGNRPKGIGGSGLNENVQEGLRALNELISSREVFPNYWAQGNDETVQLFAEGQVSVILCTYFNLNEFAHLPLEYDICPLPSLQRGDPQKTLLLSIGMALVRHSKWKEAARRFVDFLASEDAQNVIRDRTVSIPARKASAERAPMDGLKRPSRYWMFREMFPSFSYHRDLGLQIKDLRQFTKWLKEYWSDMIDEETLRRKLEELYRTGLKPGERSTAANENGIP
ncbi:extracellular solute-binding protein [Cohnella thailandensis]|uniref:Extracellular solute-binding protein n=1 Tax=Cohnella thailandensis TaxID=557557 RepID=A0A841SXH2_9BACL|nr:extracellular solute-binding protein [Cohnella thailandensis]MBB6635972.1 extracellular solute-binding protein [Cohnella thailandensis]MBP1976350.1 multiple sugar transport system substrate-binding protein [Cohnella thailandensis]